MALTPFGGMNGATPCGTGKAEERRPLEQLPWH
jgi:hypothetical protein